MIANTSTPRGSKRKEDREHHDPKRLPATHMHATLYHMRACTCSGEAGLSVQCGTSRAAAEKSHPPT
jgi:hypothetical protein